MPGQNRREVDELAARVCDAAQRVLGQATSPISGADWDPAEYDPLHETANAVDRYRRWESTGVHDFFVLRPGLEPQIALADQIATGLSSVLSNSEEYDIEVDRVLRDETEHLLIDYVRERQTAGGPGTVNAETWQR